MQRMESICPECHLHLYSIAENGVEAWREESKPVYTKECNKFQQRRVYQQEILQSNATKIKYYVQ